MGTVPYHYPRALELEGRHPADAGCWGLTVNRLEVGEGLPFPELSSAWVNMPPGGLIPPTTDLPRQDLWHNFFYRRIRNSDDCIRHLLLRPESGIGIHIAFRLTAAWADPPGGLIPVPSERDHLLPQTHAARVFSCLPDRRLFHFSLQWPDWGDFGTGYMPYQYFDRHVFESWAIYQHPSRLRLFRLKKLDEHGHCRWSAHDEDGHRVYAFEVRDSELDDRYAWAFVIERDEALEVEELFVRPEHRRVGHGRWLADQIVKLANEKKMPLRFWVAFTDSKSEHEANQPAVIAIARRLGVQFQSCTVPWAAYFATNEMPGSEIPIEPAVVPCRPRTPKSELLATVMALGLAGSMPSDESKATSAPSSIAVRQAITLGTAKWAELTERRAELIHKKNRQGLTEAEREEFDRLQELSRATIAQAFPPPASLKVELATIEKRLGRSKVNSSNGTPEPIPVSEESPHP